MVGKRGTDLIREMWVNGCDIHGKGVDVFLQPSQEFLAVGVHIAIDAIPAYLLRGPDAFSQESWREYRGGDGATFDLDGTIFDKDLPPGCVCPAALAGRRVEFVHRIIRVDELQDFDRLCCTSLMQTN